LHRPSDSIRHRTSNGNLKSIGLSDKRGPHLQGLFGRAPGAVKGFPYRITLQTENPIWTEADLDYWIYNHARLKEADRSDLIAYLKRSTRK
jgi:cytochrome c2